MKIIKQLYLWLILTAAMITIKPVMAETNDYQLPPRPSRDFFMVSIPKSGTHLMAKLLRMLTNRRYNSINYLQSLLPDLTDEEFAETLFKCKKDGEFAYNHTTPHVFGPYFLRFAKAHPEYLQILQIRDLRDVLISYIFHFKEQLQHQLGPQATFDDMLNAILSKTHYYASAIERNIISAIEWIHISNIYVVRFEDIIGPKGKGSLEVQRKTIRHLAYQLGISLTQSQLDWIADNLFGIDTGPIGPSTFRSGQIGSWRQYFKPHHVELFKKEWGTYQIALGYPLED